MVSFSVAQQERLADPFADTLDSWFHDLQQYESTLDALATASLDQAFTDELNAIEQCESFRRRTPPALMSPQGSAS